jgi:hypothetical protein
MCLRTNGIISFEMQLLHCGGSPIKTSHFKLFRMRSYGQRVHNPLGMKFMQKQPGWGGHPAGFELIARQGARNIHQERFLGAI